MTAGRRSPLPATGAVVLALLVVASALVVPSLGRRNEAGPPGGSIPSSRPPPAASSRVPPPEAPTAPTTTDPAGPPPVGLPGSLTAGPSGRSPEPAKSTSTRSVPVGDAPFYAAYDPRNGFVYVPNIASGNVSVINGTSVVGEIGVGAFPEFAAYDGSNGYVYVVNEGSQNVSVLNGTESVGSVDVAGEPAYAGYDPSNGDVYVTGYDSGTVSVIRGTSVVATVPVGSQPVLATYDPSDLCEYIPISGAADVAVIRGTTVVAWVSTGTGPGFSAYDSLNGDVYVPNWNDGNVSVIRGTEVVGTVDVGSDPAFAVYDASNGDVYVSNEGSNNVSVINGVRAIGSLVVGSAPWDLTYDSGNGDVYAADPESSMESVLSGTRVVGVVPVGDGPGYAAFDPGNGYLYVPNEVSNNVSVIPTWASITFTESGLPVGIEWWVNITRGPSTSSLTSSICFTGPAGTYEYTVATLEKTYRSLGGVVVFNGTSMSQAVAFSSVTYPLTFTETGLPAGTNWSVTIRGTPMASESATIVAPESNGTCPYSIGELAGWTTPAFSGAVDVAGAPINETVPWSVTTYSVAFVENDLPMGTNWSVSLGGETRSSTQDSIEFSEPNGTYPYSVGIVPGWATSRYDGAIPVRGADLSEVFHWAPVTYTVAFSESGLPGGTNWSVTFDGVVEYGTLPFLAFVGVPNGTYDFTVGPVPDHTAAPRNGSIAVRGLQAFEAIRFTTGSDTVLGLPATEGYAAAGGILAAVALGALAGVLRARRARRMSRSSDQPSNATQPPRGP